ncbi:scavenger mRNA decapping enzyme [Martensiomyces pterosporus]|nr:scavenger mRNA decapping enzyme [Martensiomyces pterosporus]
MSSRDQPQGGVKNIESLVRRFKFTEVLNEDASSKTIWLLGYISKGDADEGVVPGENAAVVTLERLAFSAQGISSASASQAQSSSTLLNSVSILSGEENDIYSWASGFIRSDAFLPDLRVALIYPAKQKHIDKYRRQERKWIRETPKLYDEITKPFIDAEPASRIQWVYNILSKQAEADRIVFEDPDPKNGFIVLPDLKWDGTTVDSMYLVAIVNRHDIKSLRDLKYKHLPLLKNIRGKAEAAVQRYGVAADQLRLYIHYQPSYYHFHVHITNVNFDGRGMLAGRAHLMDTVIDNIENIAPDYYQKATLSYVLGSNDDLWPLWKDCKQ